MEYSQPTNSIPIPEDIKKAVEDAQNRSIVLNADVTRLKKVVAGEHAAIATLSEEKAAVTQQIKALEETKISKEREIESIDSNNKVLKKDFDNLTQEVTELRNERDSTMKDIADRTANIQNAERELSKKQLEHEARQNVVLERERVVADRHEKIRKFSEDIQ